MAIFDVKTFTEAFASMVNWVSTSTSGLTDFNIGSKVRTILESVALELEELYMRIYFGILNAIDSAVFMAFNFPLLPPVSASGTVTFSRSTVANADIIIPIGTQVWYTGLNGNIYFATTVAATLYTGSTAVAGVAIDAVVPGASGNVDAGQITGVAGVTGIEFVTNILPTTGGSDLESQDERRERFAQYISTLSRGTKAALEYSALTVPGIVDAKVIENPYVAVLVDDLSFGAPVDNSALANTPHEQVFNAFPSPPNAGSCLYIGAEYQFDKIYIDMSVYGVYVVPATPTPPPGYWEFWNGSVWEPLTIGATPPDDSLIDGTLFITQRGAVTWNLSAFATGWAKLYESTTGLDRFWMRFRANYNYSVMPEINQIFMTPEPGWVILFCHEAGGVLGAVAKAAVEAAVEDYRAASVKVTVDGPALASISIAVGIKIGTGGVFATLKPLVENAILVLIAGLAIGEPLYYSKLIQTIMDVDSTNILQAEVTTPTDDIFVGLNQLLTSDLTLVTVTQI